MPLSPEELQQIADEEAAGLDDLTGGVLADDLTGAIVALFHDTMALSIAFPTGPSLIRPDRQPDDPWVEVRGLSARPSAGTIGDWLDCRLRFTVYGADLPRAIALRRDIEATFEGVRLRYDSGSTTPWHIANRSDEQPVRPTWVGFPFKAIVDFSFHERRSGS